MAANTPPRRDTPPGKNAGAIASMTGFARAQGQLPSASWTVEIKSVNGRALDVRCRFPSGFDSLETHAKTEIGRRIRRGNVNVAISIARTTSGVGLRLNRDLLAQVIDMAAAIEAAGAERPRVDALLSVRGIIEPVEEEETEEQRAELETAIAASLTEAVERLAEARAAEGAHLAAILHDQLDMIERLSQAAAATAALQPETLRAKLRQQLETLLGAAPALPEDRLAQEAALLIAKADVREELDRLRAHVSQARSLLAEGTAVGRRLDFLCQEFNREANTLCSKSADVELTRIGLELKATIEQFREQIQNIE